MCFAWSNEKLWRLLIKRIDEIVSLLLKGTGERKQILRIVRTHGGRSLPLTTQYSQTEAGGLLMGVRQVIMVSYAFVPRLLTTNERDEERAGGCRVVF